MINPDEVSATIRYCLFKEGEDTKDAKLVQGLVRDFGFHPGRLAEKKPDIDRMLLELPDVFQKSKGGGWSFLQACETRDGVLWGQHSDMERLLCLGIAVGSAEYLLPRDMWAALPGGVPYFAVLLDGPTPVNLPAGPIEGEPGGVAGG